MLLGEREREALHGAFHRLERRWNVLPIPDTAERHAYDPLPFWLFLDGLRAASAATEGRRLLDVGCGVGRNLAIAASLGWTVRGIERHEPYATAARELLPESDITVADAFDVESFDADLVYLYRPMRSDSDQDALEAHVIGGMTSGSLLFLPARARPSLPMRQVGHEVWERL